MSSVGIPEEKAFDQFVADLVDGVKTPHKQKDARNKAIFLGFHGVFGGEGTTLDEQGRAHGGITRECVRQIVANMQANIFLSDEQKKVIKRMIGRINETAPCSLDQVTDVLKNEGFLSVEIENPKGLINLAFALIREKASIRFDTIGETTFVIPFSRSDLASKVKSETQKIVGKYGVCSVSGICIRLGLSSGKANKDFVQSVLSNIDSVEFLADEWLTCDPGYKDRLTKRVEGVFSIYKAVEIRTLYHVMARSLRQIKERVKTSPEFKAFGIGSLQSINEERKKAGKPALNRKPYLKESDMRMAFDIDVFIKYLSRFDNLEIKEIDGKVLVCAKSPMVPEEGPSSVVLKTISILGSEKKKQMRETEIKKKAELSEKEWFSFITASNFSPYISRADRGIYAMLGDLF